MRYAVIGICVSSKGRIDEVNRLISENSSIVLGRMGLPLREHGLRLISLIVEGNTDAIGKMAGQIGQLEGVEIKSMIMKNTSRE